MCQAPNDVEEKQLRELHIRTVLVKNKLICFKRAVIYGSAQAN